MSQTDVKEAAEFLRNDVRLRTFPIGVKFLKSADEFPEKTRRPSTTLGKRVTICMAVTMARLYGWTVGLTKEDLICVPAMIAFGLSGAEDPVKTLETLFCDVTFASGEEKAAREVAAMIRFENDEFPAMLLAPLQKALFEPDTVVVFGNPAQVMRMVQAVVHQEGRRVVSSLTGKVECTEYLIAPFKRGAPRISIPGMGDRIFSMTQDDEMVFAIPGTMLAALIQGLKEAGKAIGARYPVTFYQNFQPDFPKPYQELAKELALFE